MRKTDKLTERQIIQLLATHGSSRRVWPDHMRQALHNDTENTAAIQTQKSHEAALDNWLNARIITKPDHITKAILDDFDAYHRIHILHSMRQKIPVLIASTLSIAACLFAGVFTAPYILDMMVGNASFITTLEMTSVEIWNN